LMVLMISSHGMAPEQGGSPFARLIIQSGDMLSMEWLADLLLQEHP
jgi:L-cystine uptake protein TcyP (sodium:dicarboxylate symporter family)